MPNINEYSQNLVLPQYKETSYNPELEVQVARYNQANYNRVLNTVRGLQSQALNVQMLNQEGQQRLDQYNDEINQQLSGDLGDLTKAEVQNRIGSVFQNLASDTQLIKASQLSGEYQKQLDTIESYRASGRKDKGYNSINETVFKEWDGGLYDFMGSGLNKVTSPTYRPAKYVPFKELDTKLLNIAKTLHASSSVTEQGSGTEGYILHQEIEGVTPERIREMMLTQFDQEDLEQLEVLSKYEVIKNRKLNSIPDFYNKYNLYADQEIKRTETQANTRKQQAEYLTTLINKKDTPQEKKLEYTELVNRFSQESDLYSNRANSLRSSKKNLGDFEKMSNDELLKYAQEIQWFTKINGVADAMSWKKEVNTYKLDQVWKVNKEIDAMRWREELRAQTKLTAEKMRAAGKQPEAPKFSGAMDVVKNPQSFVDSYQTLTQMADQMGKVSDRVVTSPSFDSSQLLDENFLKTNKDNYEIKMWDVFSQENPTLAIKDGKPQLEAFKMWMKDKEANPQGVTAGYITEQNRNQLVSDWLDKQVSDINQKTREGTNEYDLLQGYPLYKADGSSLNRDEYNKGVPAYIGVPTDQKKSGYKLVRIEDALKEAEDFSKREIEYIKSSTQQGGVSTVGTLGTMGLTKKTGSLPSSYITNDKGLYQTLLNVSEKNKQVREQLQQELLSKLPQIFQQPLVEAMNEEAKLIYYSDVVNAAKNTNEGKQPVGQFAFFMDDIAFIRPPVTGNKGQFQLKPTLSQTYKESGWQLPDADDPTKLVPIIPGGSYSFFTNKPYMPYDVLYNEMVKDMPIEQGYKGYKIRIAKSKLDKNTTVQVFDSKGQLINGTTTDQPLDVTSTLRNMQSYIDSIK